MTMFVNYIPHTGVTVSRSRQPGAYYGEICDVAAAVTYNHESCCCDLDGALAALEDGAYWQDHRVTTEALEVIHAAIIHATESDQALREGDTPDA